jgi:hypothetical protein
MSRKARVRQTLEWVAMATLLAACNPHPSPTSDEASLLSDAAAASVANGSPSASSAPPEPGADSYADKDPTALQDFHPALDAHGTWADDPKYGTVWTPSASEAGPDFVPYVTAGHWVYDELLWTSDYEWGWAPFHYGRWVLIDGRGWSWIPGREYAPAWVDWRTGDEYLGWAPTPPLFVWRGGIAVTVGFAPPPPPLRLLCSRRSLRAATRAHRHRGTASGGNRRPDADLRGARPTRALPSGAASCFPPHPSGPRRARDGA